MPIEKQDHHNHRLKHKNLKKKIKMNKHFFLEITNTNCPFYKNNWMNCIKKKSSRTRSVNVNDIKYPFQIEIQSSSKVSSKFNMVRVFRVQRLTITNYRNFVCLKIQSLQILHLNARVSSRRMPTL